MFTFLRHGYANAQHKYLCPGIYAAPVATKILAAHALNTKEATPKGIPPPKNQCGAPALPPSVSHWFFRGEGIGHYYTDTRETQH
eukprot:10682446-Ditylum_brightwellii.AAC.1